MLYEYVEIITDDGVTELFNNVRTYEYSKVLGISGVKSCGCACAAQLACDPPPYTCRVDPDDECFTDEQRAALDACGSGLVIPLSADSPGAPWWDARVPASYDFAGVYVLGSTGWNSNSSRTITPNALSGSSFGVTRRDGRCITYDLVFIARSKAGYEYGVSYYDALLDSLDECGSFTIGTATHCPDPDCTEEELKDIRRYLRQSTVGSGIDIISTRVTGCCKGACGHFSNGGVYGQGQVTLCSEQPWIYTDPDCVVKDCAIDLDDCVKAVDFVGSVDQVAPVMGLRNVKTARDRYKIKITRDGKVCKVGDWDWSETQYGGGTGIVVLDEQVEAQEVNLTVRQRTETTEEECDVCQIVLYYDVDNAGANPNGPAWFETLGWSHPAGTALPCDCDIEIAGIYTRNDSYDPDADPSTDPTSNREWRFESYSGSNDTSESCCYVDLEFTAGNTGTWAPTLGGQSGQDGATWDPAGRNPFTGEQNFPPLGCNLVVRRFCDEDDEEEVDDNTYYDGAIDGYTRVGVQGPVTYRADGSWVSFDGIEGCLPNGTCAQDYPLLVPKIENADAIDKCETNTDCVVIVRPEDGAIDGTWDPDGWFHDVTAEFPNVECNYILDRNQVTTDIVVQEEYEISPGSCGPTDSGFEKIFPSFTSDCWEPIFIPTAQVDAFESCYCLPLNVSQKCFQFTNRSGIYCAAGSMSIRPGSSDLKNFRIRGWISVFDDEVDPCEDCDRWIKREPDFTLEVPHIPSGSTLTIDSEARKGLLSFPGGSSEPAIRYVSGACGAPFDYIKLGPCETMYFLVQADPNATAENMTFDVCFSNYYGASGSLIG